MECAVITTNDDCPVACNLNGMTAEQRERHIALLQLLRGSVEQTTELPAGYEFRYAGGADTFMAAAEFITLESLCCSFFHFCLEQEPTDSAITIRITGPVEAKPIIVAALQN